MPNTTVAAILVEDSDETEVLLTRRNINPFQGQWCLPGGYIEPYEPVQEMKRAVLPLPSLPLRSLRSLR